MHKASEPIKCLLISIINETDEFKNVTPQIWRHSGLKARYFSVFEIKRENDSSQIKINFLVDSN